MRKAQKNSVLDFGFWISYFFGFRISDFLFLFIYSAGLNDRDCGFGILNDNVGVSENRDGVQISHARAFHVAQIAEALLRNGREFGKRNKRGIFALGRQLFKPRNLG